MIIAQTSQYKFAECAWIACIWHISNAERFHINHIKIIKATH